MDKTLRELSETVLGACRKARLKLATAESCTGGLVAAGLGIVLYNVAPSGIAVGLLILGFARPAPATA